MQQKICPSCNEVYQNFIDYCFRDGSKLGFEGQVAEVEDTELLSFSQKITQKVSNSGTEDLTAPINFAGEAPVDFGKGEIIEEDLDAPTTMGNTQMFRKEDLIAMFQDDSTYNGELIDADEATTPFESDTDTEEMEATETFDLASPKLTEEKTEFEEAISPMHVVPPRPINLTTMPEQQEYEFAEQSNNFPPLKMANVGSIQEKEGSSSSLFLLGGLMGIIVAGIGFYFFQHNQEKSQQTNSSSNNVPRLETPGTLNTNNDGNKIVEDQNRENNQTQEVGSQSINNPTVITDNGAESVPKNTEIPIWVELGDKKQELMLSFPIMEEDLLQKLRGIGFSVDGERTIQVRFYKEIESSSPVEVTLSIPPDPNNKIVSPFQEDVP